MNKFSAQFHDEVTQISATVAATLAEQAAPHGQTPRFDKLVQVFGLNDAEADLLRCLIAAHFDPALAQVFDERSGYGCVTEYLIRSAFDHANALIYTSDSPLNVWRLVIASEIGPGAPLAFAIDTAVLEWLAGKPGLEPALIRLLRRPGQAGQPDASVSKEIDTLTDHLGQGRPTVCTLALSDGADAEVFLAATQAQLKLTVWCVDAKAATLDDDDIAKLHRFARVQNAALAWDAAKAVCLTPRRVPPTHLQFAPDTAQDRSILPDLKLRLAGPDTRALTALLCARFPDAAAADIHAAAVTKGLSPSRISDPRVTDLPTLISAQRRENAEALVAWAVPLPTTMGFDDLVLEEEQTQAFRHLVTEINAHASLWQDPEIARVYAQERALTVLLKGPPGTGKTLTARVLAREAGLPLYRVDAASLTSKYIGETAENMRALFKAANRSGAMLFIDEFEAIVGKRTETRNEIARSYNHDTAYFLQLIETQFEGVAIFATNRPAEIDEAMHRRIRKVYDFALPEEAARAALWNRALAPFAVSAEVMAFGELLAEVFPFSGSRIKSIVLNAHALAHGTGAALSIADLRAAALAEAKNNGRLPAKRELARIAAFDGTTPEGRLQ
ncbi:MAG: ATP-binding protein [Pseudomonadota bacterium]